MGHITQSDRPWVEHPCCRQCRKFWNKLRNMQYKA